MSDKRAAIIELHRAGKTNSEIVKLLKAPRSTVYHTVSRFKELQSKYNKNSNNDLKQKIIVLM